jgi:outer membrane protein, multidrug efflux system
MSKRFAVTLLALLTAGCMVGPDYRHPSLDVPQNFRNETGEGVEAVDTQWWRCFRDPVLDSLIAEALANNKNLQIASANIEQAAAVVTPTRAPLFPQLNYGGDASRQRASESNGVPVGPNPFNTVQLFAGVNWELDLWGRVRRLSEAARADFFATTEARRGVILSLVSSVAGSYLQLLGLDEQLAIARRSLNGYGEGVRLYELQFQHGLVSQMTVEQARSQYETAAALIPDLESQIVQNENALSILLGRNPGPVARGRNINEITFPAVPAGLPSQLLERRPDLAQAQQNLIAANALIGAARALYFPTISLTGDFGYQSDRLSALFKSPSRIWSYAGSLTGPLFTAGSISGQVRASEAAQQAALVSYQAAVQKAFADVENALVVRRKLTEQIAAQERLVRANREYESLAKLQYDGGYAPYLTVLNAQQLLFPAELNLAQLRASLFTSYANLYKAMGGGWVTEAERLSAQPFLPPPTIPAEAATK